MVVAAEEEAVPDVNARDCCVVTWVGLVELPNLVLSGVEALELLGDDAGEMVSDGSINSFGGVGVSAESVGEVKMENNVWGWGTITRPAL